MTRNRLVEIPPQGTLTSNGSPMVEATPVIARPLSKLGRLAVQQVIMENQRRFAEVMQIVAENDQIVLTDGWRLDLDTWVWAKPEKPEG